MLVVARSLWKQFFFPSRKDVCVFFSRSLSLEWKELLKEISDLFVYRGCTFNSTDTWEYTTFSCHFNSFISIKTPVFFPPYPYSLWEVLTKVELCFEVKQETLALLHITYSSQLQLNVFHLIGSTSIAINQVNRFHCAAHRIASHRIVFSCNSSYGHNKVNNIPVYCSFLYTNTHTPALTLLAFIPPRFVSVFIVRKASYIHYIFMELGNAYNSIVMKNLLCSSLPCRAKNLRRARRRAEKRIFLSQKCSAIFSGMAFI